MVEPPKDYYENLHQLRQSLDEAQRWGAFETCVSIIALVIMGTLAWFISL